MSEHIIETEVCAGTAFVPIGGTGKLREEIVRCKDCKYLIAHGMGCSYWDNCDIESVDGFCAWGERK